MDAELKPVGANPFRQRRPEWPLAAVVVAAVLCSAGLLLAIKPNGREHLAIGLILGIVFGQTNVAAAWVVLGPGPLLWRLPLSLAWFCLLFGCFALNIGLNGGPNSELLELGACFFGQWVLVQGPLWLLAIFYGLRLQHETRGEVVAPGARQFGLQQLMIFTAIIGVVLGLGRALVLTLLPARAWLGGETVIFIFLAIAAIVTTLPLLISSLLPRWALPATVILLVLIALATLFELPLLRALQMRGPGPDTAHLCWINLFTSAWVLIFTLAARFTGYRLATAGPSAATS